MADTVVFKPVPNAPILDAYLVHAQFAMNLLLKQIGNGDAAAPTIAKLNTEATGLPPNSSGYVTSAYTMSSSEMKHYMSSVNGMDADVVNIAADAAGIANDARTDVLGGITSIQGIISQVNTTKGSDGTQHPTPAEQFAAIDSIQHVMDGVLSNVESKHAQLTSMNVPTPSNPPSVPGTTSGGSSIPTAITTGLVTPTGGSPLTGGQTVQAKQIYDYLVNTYHLSPTAAAGILGNMQVESSFNTGAYNAAEGAVGLAQWEGNRSAALQAFAAANHESPSSWKTQVDFMMSELRGGNFPGVLSQIQAASTPAQAAAIFDQYYEKSAGTSRGQREGDATLLASEMGNSQTSGAGSLV